MNIKSVSAGLALVFLAAGCSTTKVTCDRNENYDFSHVKTYQWIDGPADILNEEDTYTNEDFRKSLNHELARRNLRELGGATKADMQVAYYIKLKEEHQYAAPASSDEPGFAGGVVYSGESRSWKLQEQQPDINVYAVEIGTLTVLCHDAKTGQKIWTGTLTTKIDRSLPEDRQQEYIGDAVEKLMGRFPFSSK